MTLQLKNIFTLLNQFLFVTSLFIISIIKKMLKRIVLTFTKPVGRRCFAMGLKRPKLSDTFNFPKNSEYLSEDHFYQEGDENTKVEE